MSKKINFHHQKYIFLTVFLFLGLSAFVISKSSQSQAKNFEISELTHNEYIKETLSVKTETLFSEKEIVFTNSIPFETIYEDNPELEIGNSETKQEGINGTKTETYKLYLYEGVEIDRELINIETTPAQNEIISKGTKIVIRQMETPDGIISYKQKLNVYATPYTTDSAGGSGYTATGTKAHFGSIAVDPAVIPFGTKMYIPGYGIGVAEDTGGAINGNMIDLFYEGNHGWWDSKWVEIYILSH
ncbi:hypothetical protein A2X44_05470 [candidate division CPR3 bacterium GWF2_35_18]|uniref:3D/G5 domain protein n=1 Tax=candidate division CPR3 bacterium GW2011_GWF2_35_18 TaxID=1618350 RepID=A0A0G0BI80_UNCC3|nr:MAG: 3D/G5 domain protein [candidate division CPR3 bacterium GW2011_GWF2_35_18]OGB63848.1 MAG: hypothetical protein A2X44_05470 [candidate division CPR3 bacterium GWF2_35_18]OGB65235.1 MAG: hypothetical protein A2250_03220 [candidate division CPR3 bacterium RIFOXYA2_FULL_35_13]OGB77253.1 MAG: hypothetical protein A2476_04360 [candidate division CPR3 bacterium RIFOXYC2_FULL_35_7]OGB79401.1 MAG: hypothetical protein A2296_04725 [candidate division CPR3 bacterium RIFOXYB2_FULL_35_8]